MRIVMLGAVALAIIGCSQSETPKDAVAPETAAGAPETAAPGGTAAAEPASNGGHRVNLKASQGGEVGGALEIAPADGGVLITGVVGGLKPESEHGFHVHEKGDCSSPDFKSAGDHFNPSSEAHGNPASSPHHRGDVLNIKANNEGKAEVNAKVEGVTLGDRGPNDIVGRAIVVHEKPDDYQTQPSGNSGDRISCGVIE
jgi:superoxide dismutase, Cu-Zn family